jgi:transposase
MIGPSGNTQILVATKPVDFRKQADSLAALVQQALGADPFSGTVYVFRAKRIDRVKLIWWDGTGLCLLSKRLEGGQYRWPRIEDGVMRLTPASCRRSWRASTGRAWSLARSSVRGPHNDRCRDCTCPAGARDCEAGFSQEARCRDVSAARRLGPTIGVGRRHGIGASSHHDDDGRCSAATTAG